MNNLYYMGIYDSNDYYRGNYNFDYSVERTPIFYNENEGFIKGNIQKNSYNPYHNYNPSLPNLNNDSDRLLLEIQRLGFYLLDLGLYLDLNPEDKEALKTFNENRVKYYRLINEFNKNYYPLMANDSASNESYKWLDGKFPFAGGK